MMQPHLRFFAFAGFVMAAGIGGCLPDMPYERTPTRADVPYDPAEADPTPPPAPGTPPDFGETVRAAVPPPPISGGTMALAPDGHTIVAADPDRDQIYVVDLETSSVRTIALRAGDEPGRVAVDAAGRAHVALRSGGDVVIIDIGTASILRRRHVCAAPRGITHDKALDRIYVACMSGELVSFAASGDGVLTVREIRRDLRDVVANKGRVVLTTFRDAQILDISDDVADPVVRTRPVFQTPGAHRVAWRMVKAPPPQDKPNDDDDVVVAEQKAPDAEDPVEAPAEYYHPNPDDDCPSTGPSGAINDTTTLVRSPGLVMPVDIAVDRKGVVAVSAGNGHTPGLAQLYMLGRRSAGCQWAAGVYLERAQLTSVVILNDDTVVALSREPAALVIVDRPSQSERARIALSTISREDTGHAIFHSNSGLGVACASCHPEGRDDGHSWTSRELGSRRTPSLLGTLAGTAPYHWNGEAKDIAALAKLTFQSRMKGPSLGGPQTAALEGWLTALRAPPALKAIDAASAARGKALFEGAGRCSTCHTGAMHTNNQTVNPFSSPGTFQVPSLVGVAWRAPYTHDGSAPTIPDLLSRGHGGGALENWGQYGDLQSYLETF